MATISICDICESRENVSTVHYTFGSQTDLAGGPSEDDFETYDLCQKCELQILRIHVYKSATTREKRIEYGKPLIEVIKRLINQRKKN